MQHTGYREVVNQDNSLDANGDYDVEKDIVGRGTETLSLGSPEYADQ
jgi:hypothetical protein